MSHRFVFACSCFYLLANQRWERNKILNEKCLTDLWEACLFLFTCKSKMGNDSSESLSESEFDYGDQLMTLQSMLTVPLMTDSEEVIVVVV